MKLTWFGGTSIRVHIGRRIIVVDQETVAQGIDRGEVVSGADWVLSLATDDKLPLLDPATWRPRKPVRPMDEPAATTSVEVFRIAARSVLIDAPGEPHAVLIAEGERPKFGRWVDGAVVVLFGDDENARRAGEALLQAARPKLIALAMEAASVDFAIDALRERLDGTGLVALEPAMALEI
jgi:hypothetical protein